MKRVAALAVISLAFLGACSSTDDNAPKTTDTPSATQTSDNTDTAKDEREFKLANGETVKFDRLGELPEEMAADIQARFDAVLEAPTADNDNFGAFKTVAAEIGSETGKYVGGLVEIMTTCDDADVATWAFAAQTMSEAFVPECGSADSKAAAQELADNYIANAMGGPAAWMLVVQASN